MRDQNVPGYCPPSISKFWPVTNPAWTEERHVGPDLVGFPVAAGRIGGGALAPDVIEAAPGLGGERFNVLALAVRGNDAGH
jgi:hypothetical protein